MSQRRGLGKGLGALIPPGGVKVPASGAAERRKVPAVVQPIQPTPTTDSGQPPGEDQSVPDENTQSAKTGPTSRPRTNEDAKAAEPTNNGTLRREDGDPLQAADRTPEGSGERTIDITESRVVSESEQTLPDVPQASAEDEPRPGAETDTDSGAASPSESLVAQDAAEQSPSTGGEFGLTYAEIRVDRIRANAQQPRKVFDEDNLQELAGSIREIGLLQPVVVRPAGDDFELVAGERRLRAVQLIGLDFIPALVRETDDDAMLRDALLENLQRVQLNPLEEAAAYSQLLADFSCTQDELAGRIGRSRPQISNTLRLLRLPPKVQRRLAAGVLSSGHARALLSFEGELRMEEVARRIVTEGLSVRAVEELALMGSDPGKPRRSRRKRSTPVEYLEAADKLGDLLETRVRIETGAKHGRVVVEFGDVEDLGRILDLIETGLQD